MPQPSPTTQLPPPPPKADSLMSNQQIFKILHVETMLADLDSGLPADTYVHPQIGQDGNMQPPFYHRTRYLLAWAADDTPLDYPVSLYRGHEKPEIRDITIDTRGCGDSILAIYTRGHTALPDSDKSGPEYITVVTFTQEAAYRVQPAQPARQIRHRARRWLRSLFDLDPLDGTFHSSSLHNPFHNSMPLQALVITVPTLNFPNYANLPPKRLPKPAPIRSQGPLAVIWRILEYFCY